MNQRTILTFVCALFIGSLAMGQDVEPAKAGVVYGEFNDAGKTVAVDNLETTMKKNKYEGKVSGKVVEVCQAMGCWVKIEKADGTTVLVKALDHGFTMPKDIVGKKVEVDGKAEVKEVSEKMRKHYAEDAGKTKEEIAQIKGASKELTIQAKGVKVVE